MWRCNAIRSELLTKHSAYTSCLLLLKYKKNTKPYRFGRQTAHRITKWQVSDSVREQKTFKVQASSISLLGNITHSYRRWLYRTSLYIYCVTSWNLLKSLLVTRFVIRLLWRRFWQNLSDTPHKFAIYSYVNIKKESHIPEEGTPHYPYCSYRYNVHGLDNYRVSDRPHCHSQVGLHEKPIFTISLEHVV